MPQLDLITFISQIFWLVFFFIFFIIIIFNNFLPIISRVIKIRSKKMSKMKYNFILLTKEQIITQKNYDNLLKKIINSSIMITGKCTSYLNDWLLFKLGDFKKNQKIGNKYYIKSIKNLNVQKLYYKSMFLERMAEWSIALGCKPSFFVYHWFESNFSHFIDLNYE